MRQTADSVLMVRPSGFGFNPETAVDNAFQKRIDSSSLGISGSARAEFESMRRILECNGIRVLVWDEPESDALPDAIFPNNWVSFHQSGRVVVYPMYSPLRRRERNPGILEWVKAHGYGFSEIWDISSFEEKDRYLEGTGSLVCDHLNRIVYAAVSGRTHPDLVRIWAVEMGYDPVIFHTRSPDGVPVYHTNVVLSVGTTSALLCSEVIEDASERSMVLSALGNSGRTIVDLSISQVFSFAGNGLELTSNRGEQLLIVSERAYHSLDVYQRNQLAHHVRIIPIPLDVIESGGGSARCMMAELFGPNTGNTLKKG
jgi:hypothetical protein